MSFDANILTPPALVVASLDLTPDVLSIKRNLDTGTAEKSKKSAKREAV